MGLTIVLLPAHGHRFLAAALAALGQQTAPAGSCRIGVVDGPERLPTADGPSPAVASLAAGQVADWLLEGGAGPVLLLRSDVAVFPDAVARCLDGPGATGARVARVRQTPDHVQSDFHQYLHWHTGHARPDGWPRCRWFDGLLVSSEHRSACGAALAAPRPPAAVLLDLECRLHLAGASVGPPAGWAGHMIEPATFESWCADMEAVGRHAWELADAWPESVLATDLGLATALVAATGDDGDGAAAIPAADQPSDESLFGWRDRIAAWHAGLSRAFARGVGAADRASHPVGGRQPLGDAIPRTAIRVVGHGVAVEGDSTLLPIQVGGVAGFRLLRGPSGGYHAYFVVADAPRARRDALDVVVEYLDRGRAVWGLDYDSSDLGVVHPPEPPGAFKRAEGLVAQEDTGRWRTARFTLPDWRFHRRCHGADLRVIGVERMDDGIIVGSVTVERQEASLAAALRVSGDLEGPVDLAAAADPAVSIVVPTHGALPYTRQCLHAIARTVSAPCEVIVVDNASTDGTRDYVAGCRGVRLVRRDRNDSFAAACNDGARLARAPLLVFLNNDTVPLAGWLTALTWPLVHGPAGITGARLLFPDDWSVQHAGIEWADAHARHVFSRRPGECVEAATPRVVFGVTGACLAIRADVFWDAGGFDERFIFGYEDLDLCMKVSELGLPTLYCPQSTLLHYQSASGRDLGLDEHNRARFLRRWSALAALREAY
jgi:GT2 family glycosyltransferase